MTRLRIAFCEDRYHSFYGAQQNLLTLAKNLPDACFSPCMVTTRDGEFASRCRRAALPIAVIPMAEVANRFGGAVRSYGALDRIKVAGELGRYNLAFWRWLRRERISAIVCNSTRLSLSLGLAARSARIPLLVFLQGQVNVPWLAAASLRLCRRMMLITSALTTEFAPALRGKYGHKLRTLNTGFRFEALASARSQGPALRKRWWIPEGSCAIGLVGSISARKGADLLLAAAPRILEAIPNAHFVLVGHAPVGHESFAEDLSRRVAAQGLDKRWTVTGFQDEMAAAYGALDISVLPSRSEGLPGVVIESMGYGLPCVATDVGGVRDVIRDTRFGRVVPPEDAVALAQQIHMIWHDELNDSSLALARATWVRERFSVDQYVRTFVRILGELRPGGSSTV